MAFPYLPNPCLLLCLCIKFNLIFFITYIFPFYLEEPATSAAKPLSAATGTTAAPTLVKWQQWACCDGSRSCKMPAQGAAAAEGRLAHAGGAQSLNGANTPRVFLEFPSARWSWAIQGEEDRSGSTAGTSNPDLHAVLQLGPLLTARKIPFICTHAKISHLLILASSEDTSLPAASPGGADGAPAPARSSFFKPKYVLGPGQDLMATSFIQNKA